jgi:hypothetical protein
VIHNCRRLQKLDPPDIEPHKVVRRVWLLECLAAEPDPRRSSLVSWKVHSCSRSTAPPPKSSGAKTQRTCTCRCPGFLAGESLLSICSTESRCARIVLLLSTDLLSLQRTHRSWPQPVSCKVAESFICRSGESVKIDHHGQLTQTAAKQPAIVVLSVILNQVRPLCTIGQQWLSFARRYVIS